MWVHIVLLDWCECVAVCMCACLYRHPQFRYSANRVKCVFKISIWTERDHVCRVCGVWRFVLKNINFPSSTRNTYEYSQRIPLQTQMTVHVLRTGILDDTHCWVQFVFTFACSPSERINTKLSLKNYGNYNLTFNSKNIQCTATLFWHYLYTFTQ